MVLEQQRFWIIFAASSFTFTLPVSKIKKPKMENESKAIIEPDQPVTMGQLLQLFQQLNPNKQPTELVTNTQTPIISEKLTNQNYTR